MRSHIAFIRFVLLQCPFLLLISQVRNTIGLCHRRECVCVPQGHGVAAKCKFLSRQMLEMKSSDFPENLVSVEMSGAREMRFGSEVFTHHPLLQAMRVTGISKVFVREFSFANMTSRSGVAFEFSDAVSLILEGMSWRNIAGPMSCLVARVAQVIIQGQAFARLVNFTAVDVQKLELLEGAFWFERPRFILDTDVTPNITLERVKMENLARMTFHSPVNVVKIISSEIKKVKAEAFSTLAIQRVIIENTTLHRVEAAAFSGQTLIQTLTFNNVSIHEFSSGAFLSGLSNLVITRSKMGTVHTGAMNVTLASASLTDNLFSRVHSKGVVLKQWSSLTISNNTFKKVDSEAFITPTNAPKAFLAQDESAKTPEFNFTGNIMFFISESAFDFSLTEEHVVTIDNNFFNYKCHCDMMSSAAIMAGGLADVFETGLCWIDMTLSRCFHLPEGFLNMRNFTETICRTQESVLCEEVQQDAAVPPHVPSITSAVDIPFDDDAERERKILGSIFAIVVVGMLIVMVLSAVTWIGRNGYCTKARRYLLPSTNSLVAHLTRMFSSAGVTPAASISRLSVHEYAELQRKLEEGKAPSEEPEIPLEDKATQTLPEELTQELLQSLKEKLNDPENYSEARDMIEHLYDLIKVEENCNRNYRESISLEVEEVEKENDNVYDVIRPKRSLRVKKELVSTGTRAPSPDKLQPYMKRCATLVSDYMEPRDRKVHTYSELPPRPDLLPAALEPNLGITEPHVYVELPTSMANRPLPAEPTQL